LGNSPVSFDTPKTVEAVKYALLYRYAEAILIARELVE
jgi:hypothetical protein